MGQTIQSKMQNDYEIYGNGDHQTTITATSEITQSMRDANAMARDMYKDKYDEKADVFKKMIVDYQSLKHMPMTILATLTEMLNLVASQNRMAQLMLISAAVDLIEDKY